MYLFCFCFWSLCFLRSNELIYWILIENVFSQSFIYFVTGGTREIRRFTIFRLRLCRWIKFASSLLFSLTSVNRNFENERKLQCRMKMVARGTYSGAFSKIFIQIILIQFLHWRPIYLFEVLVLHFFKQ